MSERTFRLTLDVRVDEPEKLIEYADGRARTCYGSGLDDLMSEGESVTERAILEAMLWSSEGPPFLDVGLEVTNARFE